MTLEVNQFLYSIRENREVILNAIAIFFILANMSFYAAHPPEVSKSDFTYSIGVGNGQSMEPVINQGDLLIVNLGDEPSEGEIVAYEAEGRFVAHEYLGGNVAKGVNNEKIDPVPVTEENTLGTVEYVIPFSSVYNFIV